MKIEITADEMIAMIKYFQKPYMMGADKIKKESTTVIPNAIPAIWTQSPFNISTTNSEVSLKG